jgi:LacI family transcriptional regulator
MPTIFDIAKKAGVSITTVSRALNGYSDVNEKTRQRIIAIAEELNYYPSAAARSLQGKRTNTIAFAPWLRDHVESRSFFKEIVGVLALSCLRYDLSLLVTGADSSQEVNENLRELAGSGRVDGIILADIKPQDERVKLLTEIDIPFVVFGRTTDYRSLTYPLVDVDGAAGIKAIVEYLYKQGHRRIAYLSGPFNTSFSLYRYSGYQEVLPRFGLEVDKRLVLADLQEQDQVQAALTSLFKLPEKERPTAIIASNDSLALNIIYALEKYGLEIGQQPGQIAVTGFDDLPFAAFLRPPLTTVRQPIEATCATLLDLLVSVMKREENSIAEISQPGLVKLGAKQFLLEPEIVIRASA